MSFNIFAFSYLLPNPGLSFSTNFCSVSTYELLRPCSIPCFLYSFVLNMVCVTTTSSRTLLVFLSGKEGRHHSSHVTNGAQNGEDAGVMSTCPKRLKRINSRRPQDANVMWLGNAMMATSAGRHGARPPERKRSPVALLSVGQPSWRNGHVCGQTDPFLRLRRMEREGVARCTKSDEE